MITNAKSLRMFGDDARKLLREILRYEAIGGDCRKDKIDEFNLVWQILHDAVNSIPIYDPLGHKPLEPPNDDAVRTLQDFINGGIS